MSEEQAGLIPINAMMGWNEGINSKKDAIEVAKGFIARRYTAVEASWYAVTPFMGGYIWEVHEGGPGKGYIESVVEALSKNPAAKYWFPSGDRAFHMMMRDGKPFGVLLSKKESLAVINSGQPALSATTKMKLAVTKGVATFWAGAAMLGTSSLFLAFTMGFFVVVTHPAPSLKNVDFSALPHAQWNQVVNTGVEEIVSKLEMDGPDWKVVKRPHVVDGLKELRDEGRKIIDKARAGTVSSPTTPQTPLPVAPVENSVPPVQIVPRVVPDPEKMAAPVPDKKIGDMSPAEKIQLLKEARERARAAGAAQKQAEQAKPVEPAKVVPDPVGKKVPANVQPDGGAK